MKTFKNYLEKSLEISYKIFLEKSYKIFLEKKGVNLCTRRKIFQNSFFVFVTSDTNILNQSFLN